MHDPTTSNRQGPDTGSQYRSGIFYHDEEQESIAREVTEKVNEKWWKGKVVTEILPAGEWWDAEDYHQKVSILAFLGFFVYSSETLSFISCTPNASRMGFFSPMCSIIS